MCGSYAPEPKTETRNETGKVSASGFAAGDRVSGLSVRGNESTRRTGEFISGQEYEASQIRVDGRIHNVWSDTLRAEPFVVGDRVIGKTAFGFEVAGVIQKIDSSSVLIKGTEINPTWVSNRSVRMDPRPAPAEATTAPAPSATTDAVSAPHDPALVGNDIDYNKPIQTIDGETAELMQVLTGQRYPFLVKITKEDGDITVDTFDLDGDGRHSYYTLENKKEEPAFFWGRLVRDTDDDEYLFDGSVYTSEQEAREGYLSSYLEIVSVFKVETKAKVEASSDDEAEDAGDENGDTVDRVLIGNEYVVPGQGIGYFRKGYGNRYGTALKLRANSTKSVFFQPDDGSNPYWALDKNKL
jgi:hypothetical protein